MFDLSHPAEDLNQLGGTDIRVIQELLGHNDLKTTVRYTQVSIKKISNVQSPLDQLEL
jgi:integrase/recombinase XerD